MAKVRFGIQLEEEMKIYCMEKSQELGISMSGFLNVVLAQYKQGQESIQAMVNMKLVMKKLDEISKKSK